MIPLGQTIADALDGTHGTHDTAIAKQHGLTIEEVRKVAEHFGVSWCEGCLRYVSSGETCRRKRKGCPLR